MRVQPHNICEADHRYLDNKRVSLFDRIFRQTGYMLIMLTMTTQTNANDAVLDEARALIAHGEFAQAYEALQSDMINLAGEPGYDYLLGVSALEAQQPGKAIFALERVIASEPNNGGARFDYARALFMVKQYDQAKKQFDYVLALRPPEKLKDASNSYLQMINKKLTPWSLSGYVQLDLGEDSNANSSTDQQLHGVFILDEQSVSTKSTMMGYRVNGMFEYRKSSRTKWNIGGTNLQRQFPSAEFVNQDINIISAGINNQRRHLDLSWNLSNQTVSVDEQFNNMITASRVSASYRHKEHTVSAGVTNSVSRFNANNLMRNVNQHGVTASHQMLVSKHSTNLFGTQAMLARDFPADPEKPEYERNLASLSHFGMLGANKRAALRYSASIQFSDYKNGFLGTNLKDQNRNEWTKQFSMGAVIRPANNWQITSQLQYIERHSTISLYSFNKTNMTLGIKRSI